MPAAERDIMLMSAGFAPQSAHAGWSADVREAVTTSITHVLKGQEPFPAVLIDRIWNLQQANASAERFFAIAGATGNLNLLREILSPGVLRTNISNWTDVARALLRLLDLEVARRPHDDAAKASLMNSRTFLELPPRSRTGQNRTLRRSSQSSSTSTAQSWLFSLIATVGMSMDATLDDLRIETLLPADEPTRQWFADLDH